MNHDQILDTIASFVLLTLGFFTGVFLYFVATIFL